MRNLKSVFLSVALSVVISAPALAGGGSGALAGAKEVTQLANNSELAAIYGESVTQVANQVEQISNQLKQYEQMLIQGKTLPDRVWVDALSQLEQLNDLAATAAGLYNGYRYMEGAVTRALENSKNSTLGPLESEQERGEAIRGTITATATLIDETYAQQKVNLQAVEQMQQRSAGAVGQMQAIQAGNEIAALATQELITLKTNVNAVSTLLMEEQLREEKEREEGQKWVKEQTSVPAVSSTSPLPRYR